MWMTQDHPRYVPRGQDRAPPVRVRLMLDKMTSGDAGPSLANLVPVTSMRFELDDGLVVLAG